MEDNKVEFVNGLIVKKPHEAVAKFIKVSGAIKSQELIDWLKARNQEWVRFDVKESKSGKWYAQVNDWKPENQEQKADKEFDDIGNKEIEYPEGPSLEDIPF